ncbi:MAG: aldehyde-activating protein [Oceanospirillaceae bacterium]|nr:aldehyde-activating protein [Oceanospirillaceae bacterium]MBT11731.1 aldehyde-activating protein [Oceanospirillaceae bacterium]|tara:strand:+ start:102800 stop:103216 length:417 start_codon:yes stop_codon:yes gene_type:complete
MNPLPHHNLTGGCQCGATRYRVQGTLIDASICHCSMCRKASGAPLTAWATYPRQAFAYTHGKPAIFRSSDLAEREFCPHCGAQLAFRFSAAPDDLDVSISTLDDPDAVQPQFHIWVKNKVPWLVIGDDLPQYEESEPG